MTLEQVTWQYICKHYPVFAQNFLQEYHRCNGFIPYEPGFVYVIHAVGSNYYKIGKSINPDRRLLQIAPLMPFRTRFIKVWHSYFMSLAETILHSLFNEERVNGEWFEFNQYNLQDLLGTWGSQSVRYAYGSKINRLLWLKHEEGKRFESEFGYSIFNSSVTGKQAIDAVETLFACCHEALDPGLPDDIKAIINESFVVDEANKSSSREGEQ